VPDGQHVHGARGLILELLAEPVDVHVHGSRFASVLVTPHGLENLVAGADLVRVPGEIGQQLELLWCERDQRAALADFVPVNVDGDRACRVCRGGAAHRLLVAACSSQGDVHARQ
jgi:hypothetical protein